MLFRSICFFALALTFVNSLPTQHQVDLASAAIKQLLEDNSGDVTISGASFKDYPFIAGFVRLAFHDCVGVGKCDGCINYNLPSNNGISTYAQALDAVYDANEDHFGMSRADFYAFSSIVALELSTSKVSNNDEKFDGRDAFRFGRVDCSTSPTTDADDVFPSSHHGYANTIQYFADQFGFSAAQALALLGAHSLGRTHMENSGFEGRWTDSWTDTSNTDRLTPQSTLDNQYYREIDIPWKQLRNEEGNFQWHLRPVISANTQASRSDPNQQTILLNSDFCFKWLYTGDESNGGLASCSTNCANGIVAPFDALPPNNQNTCCPRSPMQNRFRRYVDDNTAFIQDFESVFIKMVNRHFDETNSGNVYSALESKKRDYLDKYSTGELEEILDELMKSGN